jgi:hypothetical protein
MQPRPPISAQRSLKAPHANNFLALPTNCCLKVNFHLYQLQCLLKNSLIFSANFFLDKVENIRDQFDSNTPVNSPSPFNYDTVFHGTTLTSFKPITAASLWSLLKKSSPKSCALDPIPTPLLFECLDAVMPVLTNIVNTSLTTGIYPSIYKAAIVKPLLKKPTLDPNELKNYRPVSNLSFMSKVLEKVVLAQVFSHLNSHNLISEFQSAYRLGHSTETALFASDQ